MNLLQRVAVMYSDVFFLFFFRELYIYMYICMRVGGRPPANELICS